MITCKNCGIQKADGQVPAQNHDLHDSVCGIFSAKKRAVPTSVQYEVNRPQRDQYHSQYLMNLVFRKKYHSAHENYGKNGHCDVERHSDFLYEFHLHLIDFHKSVLPRAESDFFRVLKRVNSVTAFDSFNQTSRIFRFVYQIDAGLIQRNRVEGGKNSYVVHIGFGGI